MAQANQQPQVNGVEDSPMEMQEQAVVERVQPQPQPSSSQSCSPPQLSGGEQRTSPRSDESRVSTSVNLQKVQEFLDQKGGRPLNHVEFAGLVSLLQNSVEDDDDHHEPFRFSKSPSTPGRGMTPNVNFLSPSTSEQMVAAAGTAAQNGRKTLARNPMGVYRWQGGGSARPRNRYQSPGFGTTAARPTIKLTPEKPKTDSKRRRVGEDATNSSPQRVPKANGSAANLTPSSSTTTQLNGSAMANGAQANGKTNGASLPAAPSTPRIRTSGVKPTTPAVPSPLRQTWGQSDSPPQASSPQPASKPTRAASFMTELIKEVTPPKKPDFANPYEAMSPLPRPPQKKQPARKTRSAAKAEAEKEKEKEKTQVKEPELTPQAIIEATVPKGSKRARPPPELIGQRSPEKRVTSPPDANFMRRSTRLNGADFSSNGVNGVSKEPSTASEVTEEDQPSPKKQRTSIVPPKPIRTTSVTVEEIDDVEMSSSSSSKTTSTPQYTLPSEVVEPGDEKTDKRRATSPSSAAAPAFPGFGAPRAGFGAAKSSAPKAPSKLRFSIQVEKDEKMEVTPEPAKTTFEAPKPIQSPPAEQPKDARSIVAAMREEDLPKYTFPMPTSSPGAGPSTLRAREAAKAAPVSSLPTYDFSKAAPTPAPSTGSASGGFNWQAAGMKPPPKPAADTWSCSVCMLSNPGGTDKCTVCDAPRADKPKPVAQGFDWSKAGIKPPPKPAGDTWTCSVCMLSNPGGATKCTVCDSPR
ncbi:hypothetical protein C8Q70DRAFT_606904 [Cubamyces menziesii]|nr:hypothetical protein C8Q70DRAFT_606904 [Cubamyces menziesii]